MKSHRLCEPDLVGKEQANSPCSPPPPEHLLLSNCLLCKSNSAHPVCSADRHTMQGPRDRQGPYLLWILLSLLFCSYAAAFISIIPSPGVLFQDY